MQVKLTDFVYFRCRKNSKIPATNNGYHDARICDLTVLQRDGYNIGLPMRPNSLIAIDVDEKNGKTGIQDLERLEKQYGKLPPTLKQQSCNNGGYHLIFSDEGIIKPRGNLGNSIDIRWNGYILCEPSVINGNHYKFLEGIDESRKFVTIARLPYEWIKLINQDCSSEQKSSCVHQKFANECKPSIIQYCDLKKVFDNCRFLQYCVQESYSLSEPQWFSMISILAPLKGGEQIIHKLSAPYPNYSFKETELKIRRAKKFGKPQSCRYISANFSEICGDCQSSNKKRRN